MTEYSPFIIWLAKRNETANTDILITGKRRIGKSWFALALANYYYRYLLDKGLVKEGFSIERNVIFEVEDWLARIQSGQLRRYDMVILDDAGTQIPSQKWFDKLVMTTLLVYQSYAELGINTVITVPLTKLVSKKLVPLSHLYGVMQGRGRCKFYQPKDHETRDKTFYPHFADVNTAPPPKDLSKTYVKYKLAYLNKVYAEYSDDIRLERNLKRKRLVASAIGIQDIIDTVLASPDDYRDAKGLINRSLIWAKIEGVDKDKAAATVVNIKADNPDIFKRSKQANSGL